VLLPEDVARIRKLKPNLYAEMRQYAMLVREVGLGEVASFKKRMEAGAAPLQYMMSNAAYGFLNGEVVFMYSKQANFNEEVGDTSLIFKPGGRNGVRDIEGTRFGIEICLDHDIGMLSRQARPDRPIDIQVVLSDAVQRKAESLSALRDKGWLIHAATAAPENGVWHKTPTGMVPAKSLGHDSVAGSELTHWEIELTDTYELADTFMAAGMDPPARRWATVQPVRTTIRSTG